MKRLIPLLALTFLTSSATRADLPTVPDHEFIQGLWTNSECQLENAINAFDLVPSVYRRGVFTFHGNHLTQIDSHYSDPQCRQLIYQHTLRGTFTLATSPIEHDGISFLEGRLNVREESSDVMGIPAFVPPWVTIRYEVAGMSVNEIPGTNLLELSFSLCANHCFHLRRYEAFTWPRTK